MPKFTDQATLIREAIISNIQLPNMITNVQWQGVIGGERKNLQVTQPYAGRGWGIFAGIENGSAALIGVDSDYFPHIIAYELNPAFLQQDATRREDVRADEFPYRIPEIGEIILQSKQNSAVTLDVDGNISLDTVNGNLIKIDKQNDTIIQMSTDRITISEAGIVKAGLVQRDIRTEDEINSSPILIGLQDVAIGLNPTADYIGIDPIKQDGTLIPKGVLDPSDGISGSFNNTLDLANAGLVEFDWILKELGDGNIGIDIDVQGTSPKDQLLLQSLGKLAPNDLGRITLGTVVNNKGLQTRFDYAFDSVTKGHGDLWKTPGLNAAAQKGLSVDYKFDPSNTLSTPKSIETRTNAEWVVVPTATSKPEASKVNLAKLASIQFHTKGANNQGARENDSYRGSLWEFQIDKEGLTKWNIPAALNTDGDESFREGRSLLWNMDGSAAISYGKEKAVGVRGNNRINGRGSNNANFVTLNAFPFYGRRDRSLTEDLEGNYELRVGKDDNVGQSIMIEADGSLSFFYGREQTPQITSAPFTALTEAAIKDTTRSARSITGRTTGGTEFDIGRDTNRQSFIIDGKGSMRLYLTDDKSENAFVVRTFDERGVLQGTRGSSGRIDFETANGNRFVMGRIQDQSGPGSEHIRLTHRTGSLIELVDLSPDGIENNITIQHSRGQTMQFRSDNTTHTNTDTWELTTTGGHQITVGGGAQTVTIKHSSGHQIVLNATDATIQHAAGHLLDLNATGAILKHVVGHSVIMDPTSISLLNQSSHVIVTPVGVDISGPAVGLSSALGTLSLGPVTTMGPGIINLGSVGTEPAVMGASLVVLLSQLISTLTTLTGSLVPITGIDPGAQSSVSTQLSVLTAQLATLLSTKVFIGRTP